MKVKDILNMARGEAMFRIIDASVRGYVTAPQAVIIEADRNVIRERFADAEVEGFRALGKNRLAIYIDAPSEV